MGNPPPLGNDLFERCSATYRCGSGNSEYSARGGSMVLRPTLGATSRASMDRSLDESRLLNLELLGRQNAAVAEGHKFEKLVSDGGVSNPSK